MRTSVLILTFFLLLPADRSIAKSTDYESVISEIQNQRDRSGDSSVLTFNLGVAQYHLERYQLAKIEFQKLVHDEKFGAIAWYNIGLVEMALRNLVRAENAFIQAERLNNAEKLTQLIILAKKRNQKLKKKKDAHEPQRLKARLRASVGIAFDDNVYRTPTTPYIDQSKRRKPLIIPDRQSSFFIPLKFASTVRWSGKPETEWLTTYRFNGVFYGNGRFNNANKIRNHLEITRSTLVLTSGNVDHRISAGPILKLIFTNDVDRDDGIDRQLSGVNVSDRFSYTSTGFKGAWTIDSPSFVLDFTALIDQRKYRSNGRFPRYDQVNYSLRTKFDYQLTKRLEYSTSYRYGIRSFDERPARNELGIANITQPRRRYGEHLGALSLRFRESRNWLFWAQYQFKYRDDLFLSYDTYRQHKLNFKITHRVNQNLRSSLSASWRDREYPNAFIFRRPGSKNHSRSVVDLSANLRQRLTKKLQLEANVRYLADNSADPRYNYDRLMGSLNLTARY